MGTDFQAFRVGLAQKLESLYFWFLGQGVLWVYWSFFTGIFYFKKFTNIFRVLLGLDGPTVSKRKGAQLQSEILWFYQECFFWNIKKIQVFTYILLSFCKRLLRPDNVTFLKIHTHVIIWHSSFQFFLIETKQYKDYHVLRKNICSIIIISMSVVARWNKSVT